MSISLKNRAAGAGGHPRCTPLSKKLFEVADHANIDLIVQVKGNQPTLLAAINDIAATAEPQSACETNDHGRNRDERRNITVFDPADKLDDTDWKDHVKASFVSSVWSIHAAPDRVAEQHHGNPFLCLQQAGSGAPRR
jgi:hypothetical protein